MAFGFSRAHFNKQPDMHLSAALSRYDAQGHIVERPDTTLMCGCVACEVFDLKNPTVRETVNCSRPLQHTIGAHKKVVLPRRYVTGNPFGEPTSDLEGLLKIFKGPNFRVGAPRWCAGEDASSSRFRGPSGSSGRTPRTRRTRT